MSYDNNNRFALWLNDRRKEATHPHLKGQGETNGPVWVSAWFSQDIAVEDKRLLMDILKRYSSKKPFLSVTIKPKESQAQQVREAAQPRQSVPPQDDFDDDSIPF